MNAFGMFYKVSNFDTENFLLHLTYGILRIQYLFVIYFPVFCTHICQMASETSNEACRHTIDLYQLVACPYPSI